MTVAGDGNGWWWPLGLTAGLATAFLSAIGAASAASLGGATAPSLAAFSFADSTGAPTVLAYENFTGTNGANLTSTTTDGGGFTWTANTGSWSVQGNQARATNVASANLLFNSGVSNGAAEATISRNGNTSWDTSVVINANSNMSDALLANWWSGTNGNIDLWKRVSGSYSLLVSVPNLYPGTIAATATVRIESPSSSVIKIYLDGVLKITYTLTAGEQTLFKSSTRRYAGIESFNDAVSTFDNFHFDA